MDAIILEGDGVFYTLYLRQAAVCVSLSVGPNRLDHACEFLKPPRACVWGNNCNLFMICCCCGVGKQENRKIQSSMLFSEVFTYRFWVSEMQKTHLTGLNQ